MGMPTAVPSGEPSESPHSPSASVSEELDHATETLAVHSGKTSEVSTTLSETPHGDHQPATLTSIQPSTQRTQPSFPGSNLKCKFETIYDNEIKKFSFGKKKNFFWKKKKKKKKKKS